MQLQEIHYNSSGKDISINQDEYRARKQHFVTNRLPFTIDVVRDGQPISLTVTVAKTEGSVNVHLLNTEEDQIVGRLYLAKPDIFPAAYYVSSIGILPAYQGLGVGQKLYHALMSHLHISLIGVDQSVGARKMWLRLAKLREIALYAVWQSQPLGNLFYRCVADGPADYAYFNYANVRKPMRENGPHWVILTPRSSKMAQYIRENIKAATLRSQTARDPALVDPFAAHIK